MSTIRLMSQNQWNTVACGEYYKERGLDNSAETRMKGHIRIFKELMPDIVGGQEVNIHMQSIFKFSCLDENLPYTVIWGNMTPLIYRADKLELLDTEYIIYPEKVEGFEGSFCDVKSKSCNVGVFRTKEDGKVFVFATTHLWWKTDDAQAGSSEVRRLQVKTAIELITKYQKKYGNCPAIFVGDMNDTYNSPAISYALGEGGFAHAHNVSVGNRHEGVGYNYLGIGGKFPGEWSDAPFEEAIDHILVKNIPEGAVKNFDR
nr:hypothetical protein [Clostridia bacterium]